MKRSEIDHYIEDALEFWGGLNFALPPFARFGPEDWRLHAAECREIFELQLGWDVTDFGSGDFLRCGLLLFTIRNGRAGSVEYPKVYAEKIMLVRENQITPRHFHWHKCEDIINRGGGNLVIELYHADPKTGKLIGGDFPLSVDGMMRTMHSGDKVILTPGESVTMEHFHAHTFYGEPGSGKVMVGEVSMVNDDTKDNCFIDGALRFIPIEEDEAPRHLLGCEYHDFLKDKFLS